MIVVVGTGRSGTSTAARILHEELGVDMGHFRAPDDNNPQGIYEDLEIHLLFNAFIEGKAPYPRWSNVFSAIINTKKEPWGFKSPVTADILGLVLPMLPVAKYIVCERAAQPVIKSVMRCYGCGLERATQLYIRRQRSIELLLPSIFNVLYIDFSERRSDEELIEIIRKFIKGERTTNIEVVCPICGWKGTVGECELDEEDFPCCLKCNCVVEYASGQRTT